MLSEIGALETVREDEARCAVAFASLYKEQPHLYYTGRSGPNFLSPIRAEAFYGFSEEGAAIMALRMRETHPMLADFEPAIIFPPGSLD